MSENPSQARHVFDNSLAVDSQGILDCARKDRNMLPQAQKWRWCSASDSAQHPKVR